MSELAKKAIYFECEKCGQGQYLDYTLEYFWEDDRAVMADMIDCENCYHQNRVIQRKNKIGQD